LSGGRDFSTFQQPAGTADEGQPLLVLFGARRLTDEHQVGVGVARPEDRLGPRLPQRAFLAALHLFEEGDEPLPPRRRIAGAHGFSPAARRFRDSLIRFSRAATFSRRRDSSERTPAPRGWRPGGETAEIKRRVRSDPHSGQGTAAAPAATSSSKRVPHSSHSNS
jgi:hypothetical protein